MKQKPYGQCGILSTLANIDNLELLQIALTKLLRSGDTMKKEEKQNNGSQFSLHWNVCTPLLQVS